MKCSRCEKAVVTGMKSDCALMNESCTSRIVAAWCDSVWREKASGGRGVAQRGREFHEQVPSSQRAVFRGSRGFAGHNAGVLTAIAPDLAGRCAYRVSHAHFSLLCGDGAHAAAAKRVNFPVRRLHVKHSQEEEDDDPCSWSKRSNGPAAG